MATKKSLPQDSPAPGKKKKKKRKNKHAPGVIVRDGKWWVVVRYREYPGGPRHASWEQCENNPTHAKEVRKALKRKLEEHGTASLRHRGRTWEDLAKYYKDNYLIPAVYVDGKKAEGRRNLKNPQSQLKLLTELIGDATKLRNMDYEFWRRIRRALITKPTRTTRAEPKGHQRSMTDVNRHLTLGRHMLKVARNGLHWIQHDPFADAIEPLITPADEKKRRRVMSFEEEAAILSHCVEPRARLRLVIIGLVDSLMRGSEFFKLRVKDLETVAGEITVQQMNTKTLAARSAPLSGRFAAELQRWVSEQKLSPDETLLDVKSVRRAWATAKRLAGVTDLRLKDLRRTGATRLLRAGYPMELISQILGHSNITMTYEYFGIDKETVGGAVAILDAMHKEREDKETVH